MWQSQQHASQFTSAMCCSQAASRKDSQCRSQGHTHEGPQPYISTEPTTLETTMTALCYQSPAGRPCSICLLCFARHILLTTTEQTSRTKQESPSGKHTAVRRPGATPLRSGRRFRAGALLAFRRAMMAA